MSAWLVVVVDWFWLAALVLWLKGIHWLPDKNEWLRVVECECREGDRKIKEYFLVFFWKLKEG
jgi:hypothetical protein